MRALITLSAVAVAAGAGVVGTAIGQGTGGTVGQSATGTLSFEVHSFGSRSRNGINPAVPRNKKRPKVADIHAGNNDVVRNGKKVGRLHYVDTITYEGALQYKGGAEGIESAMIDFGKNDLLFQSCRVSDDQRDAQCAITGGTGRFAGARGTAVADFSHARETRKKQIVPMRITFIP